MGVGRHLLFGRVRAAFLPHLLNGFYYNLREGPSEIPLSSEALIPFMPHGAVAVAGDYLRCGILFAMDVRVGAFIRNQVDGWVNPPSSHPHPPGMILRSSSVLPYSP